MTSPVVVERTWTTVSLVGALSLTMLLPCFDDWHAVSLGAREQSPQRARLVAVVEVLEYLAQNAFPREEFLGLVVCQWRSPRVWWNVEDCRRNLCRLVG